ncbi:hypothetical protein BOO69_09610 [Sulfitobacter alexandrii]|uniref:ArsR family transcriptional regulator n=1 Tax=Sulfitobacter alexandrii TaxID=1917485 RepID=A0A1J0WH52_9RHOB|nr:hypothetical protein [Sulfitobacter alexandrii]APE43641.1 hypothetical protein BOO69_09610 [Sulfitobacter alexandrii]
MSGNVFEGYSDHFDAEVRLVILKALADEPAKAMSDSLIMVVLKEFAVRRSREYLHTQLDWLERQAGAVRLRKAGTAIIAHLTERGQEHLDRDGMIVGIKQPSLPR